jgi:hypothetical protein
MYVAPADSEVAVEKEIQSRKHNFFSKRIFFGILDSALIFTDYIKHISRHDMV